MNTEENKYYSQLTKYPRIYNDVYWGNFVYEPSSVHNMINGNIIENRNKFVEDYNIKSRPKNGIPYKIKEKYITTIQEKEGKIFDHIEYYYTHDKKYILVSSPYNDKDEIYSNLGWEKINKLYCTCASTYIKFIN